jgi:hypothetical protein
METIVVQHAPVWDNRVQRLRKAVCGHPTGRVEKSRSIFMNVLSAEYKCEVCALLLMADPR